jgi:hypothetical protein
MFSYNDLEDLDFFFKNEDLDSWDNESLDVMQAEDNEEEPNYLTGNENDADGQF